MPEMPSLPTLLAQHHDARAQISPAQIEVIASAIRARAPARLLIFGLGHDAPLWQALNPGGETIFVEASPDWIERLRPRLPQATIISFDFAAHGSVGDAMALPHARLAAISMPAALAGPWDVILVDGPAGYHMSDPGRALPLYWASRLMQRATHVFVDDYNRALERHFTDLFIRFDNPPCAVVPHEIEAGKCLLWRIGRSLP